MKFLDLVSSMIGPLITEIQINLFAQLMNLNPDNLVMLLG